MRARSRAFAARSAKVVAPEQRLAWAFEVAVGRQPNEAERSAANDFFAEQSGHYRNQPVKVKGSVLDIDKYPLSRTDPFARNQPDAVERAWTDFCQMLFASDAFLYVE